MLLRHPLPFVIAAAVAGLAAHPALALVALLSAGGFWGFISQPRHPIASFIFLHGALWVLALMVQGTTALVVVALGTVVLAALLRPTSSSTETHRLWQLWLVYGFSGFREISLWGHDDALAFALFWAAGCGEWLALRAKQSYGLRPLSAGLLACGAFLLLPGNPIAVAGLLGLAALHGLCTGSTAWKLLPSALLAWHAGLYAPQQMLWWTLLVCMIVWFSDAIRLGCLQLTRHYLGVLNKD